MFSAALTEFNSEALLFCDGKSLGGGEFFLIYLFFLWKMVAVITTDRTIDSIFLLSERQPLHHCGDAAWWNWRRGLKATEILLMNLL